MYHLSMVYTGGIAGYVSGYIRCIRIYPMYHWMYDTCPFHPLRVGLLKRRNVLPLKTCLLLKRCQNTFST